MTLQKIGIRSGIAAAGLAILLAQGVLAADAETEQATKKKKTQKPGEPEVLPQMVITATKSETEAWRTASSITVVDREKIEREQLRTVVDALRDVPGVTIADLGTPGSVAAVLIRGTKTQHSLVLIDGRPVPANLAGSFNLESSTLDNIERVEVLRGPAASLYGGKTIGGVINIITRSGKGLEKPETTAFFEAGSYGTFREGLSTLGAAGDLDWSLEASRTDIQGQRINSQHQQTGASGNIGYQIDDSLRFDLNLRHYDAHIGVPDSRFMNDPDDHQHTEFLSISPRLVWDTNDQWRQSLTYMSSYFRQSYQTPNNAFPYNNNSIVRSHFWEYQSEFRPLDQWTIIAGASLQDFGYKRYNFDPAGFFNPGGRSYDVDQNETNWGVFLQSQAEVLSNLNLVAGLRYDRYSDFDDAVTWRTGVSYRLPATQTLLHANYGTAFAPPSPQDRDAAFLGPLPPGAPPRVPLEEPERSRGFEMGVEQPFADAHLNLRATYFRNELRDTFQYDFATRSVVPIGKARTRGVELGVEWQPHSRIGFNVDYTYLDAEDLTKGVRLVRRPRHSLSGSARLEPYEDVSIVLSAVYVIDREDIHPTTYLQVDGEDYLTVRLAANWRVCPNLEIFARVENLFGEQYEEAAGFPALDTGAYAGFRLRF